MSTPARRPQPGDLARVGQLPGLFRVLDFDGALYALESESGARCRAGMDVVRLAPQDARSALAQEPREVPRAAQTEAR